MKEGDNKTQEIKNSLTEDQVIEKEFQELLHTYLNSNHRRKIERITKAFQFAKEAHKGVRRRSGEPYIMHPIAVATIVCSEMGLGSTSICSALLHDVVEDTEYTTEDLQALFGDKIAQIVDGLTKISGGIFGEKASGQAENFRKLLLTMNNDIRVILIKMADRLHNMRTLDSMFPAKQYKIAGETHYIYAPLAHRLGLFSIKSELEDLSFKYEHPKTYEEIKKKLATTEKSRQNIFEEFAIPVRKRLSTLGLSYDMRARVKSIYSIWNKMQKKKIPFEEIYDLFAVRIIFDPLPNSDEKKQCWDIYSTITDIYRIRPDRIRDWVSRPKANGYQALHLTVMGPDGQWVEIQIRSRKMDEIAEKGFAAHWKYKEAKVEEDTELDRWLRTITDILESPNPNAIDFLDTIKLNLFSSEMFVFTPKGDIKVLPQNATALDFAYALHSNIGKTCIGAKANHKLIPLSQQLKSGDQVEILTSRSQRPQPEWLKYIITAKARTQIEDDLRKQHKEIVIKGQAKLEAVLKKSGLEINPNYMDKIAAYYGFAKRESLFFAIEKGEVNLPENLSKLLRSRNGNIFMNLFRQAAQLAARKATKTLGVNDKRITQEGTKIDPTQPYILREELEKRNYEVADCCQPMPGDDALGFIDDKGNVIVHKQDCPIGLRLKTNFGNRILNTEWSGHSSTTFEGTLSLQGLDSIGVLNEVTRIISNDFKVNIIHLEIDVNGGFFTGVVKVKVQSLEDLKNLRIKLTKVNQVKSVRRLDNHYN